MNNSSVSTKARLIKLMKGKALKPRWNFVLKIKNHDLYLQMHI